MVGLSQPNLKVNLAMKFHLFIGIGANLGDPAQQCQEAIRRLSNTPGLELVRASSLLNTAPLTAVGVDNALVPDYVNAVVHLQTELAPEKILEILFAIESDMGRVRREKWASRVIDLDLLFYGDQIISTPHLTVPHPEIEKRLFVLDPLVEIAPYFIHPVLKKSVTELRESVKETRE